MINDFVNMSAGKFSYVAVNAATADTPAPDEVDLSHYNSLLASIWLSELPTGGSAVVALQYKDAAGNWRDMYTLDLDNTLTEQPDPVSIDPLPVRHARAQVRDYAALAGAGGAVEVTVSFNAG
jgi:hypothetical protein